MTKEIWWNHRYVGRRLKAWPVNAKGWAALFGIVTVGLAIPLGCGLAFGKDAAFIGLPVGLAVTFGSAYWVLFNRSRRVPD
ncbi:hypothetical protein P7B02_17535 [Caulobacter segnis]|uniref:hypothetical protein n=1 Tax=Caulobacter segnis TaxID=88688 RepID=UPI00240F8EA2|nr:hypothetical protein [Caulobacter segnis]MDG2523335.1 hypothetical protein [Caulobacter segnis]